MSKITRITKPEQLTVGRLYLYLQYDKLKRGYCKAITHNNVTFTDYNWLYDDEINFISSHYPKTEYAFIAEYSATLFYKYAKLLKRQEKERQSMLRGDYIEIDEETKTKKSIWKHLFKRRS